MDEMKVNFKTLSFELTRKCNLRCAHCFRGEPQNKDIDYNVIDRTLNEVNYIETLNCSGGEPLLNIDAIKHIVNFVIEKRINVRWFTITTNGTIIDKQVSVLLNRMGKYIVDMRKMLGYETAVQCGANITISLDKFHDNNPDQALLFYKNSCNEYVSVNIQQSKKSGGGGVADDGLVYAGRAKKLSEDNFIVDSPFHKIKYENDMVKCPIEISYNGNVNIAAYQSYKDSDMYAMGNILKMHFTDMLREWSYRYPLTCDEKDTRNVAQMHLDTGKHLEFKNYNAIMIKYYSLMEDYRRALHEKFPDLTEKEILDKSNLIRESIGKKVTTNDEERKFLYDELLFLDNQYNESFKDHEETHRRFTNLTPKECQNFDLCSSKIDDDWVNYSDRSLVKKYKEQYMATAQALVEENNSRNPINEIGELFGLIAKAFQILQK